MPSLSKLDNEFKVKSTSIAKEISVHFFGHHNYKYQIMRSSLYVNEKVVFKYID